MTLTNSFLYKFFLSVVVELKDDVEGIEGNHSAFPDISLPLPSIPIVDEAELSGAKTFISSEKPSCVGVQTYPTPKVASGVEDKLLPNTDAAKKRGALDSVGKPFTHQSGPLHCTGEATYIDDINAPSGTLHASLILTRECGVIFDKFETERALKTPGVVGIYGSDTISLLKGENRQGDESVFLPLGETIGHIGQVLGIVVGESLESAEMGARAVAIKYGTSSDEKVPVSIEDAIASKSFYESTRYDLTRGDLSALQSLKELEDTTSDTKVGDLVKISGTFRSGAQVSTIEILYRIKKLINVYNKFHPFFYFETLTLQTSLFFGYVCFVVITKEHFYLETMSTLAVPTEGDTNLTIFASTQAASHTQEYIASATGTPMSKVVVRTKRMGGGFGGKETRNCFVSASAAVAAKAISRPVLLTLPRDVDMLTTGHRHCFLSKYHASARMTEDGAKLESMQIDLYANGGWGVDLSGPIVSRACLHVDGVYNFPNFQVEGVACKTAQAPHTAFRGFGGPQGIAACEHVMDHLAVACKIPKESFRRYNMYDESNTTHFGMALSQSNRKWHVPSIWDRMTSELNLSQRRQDIDEFNAKNKWVKRGAALTVRTPY